MKKWSKCGSSCRRWWSYAAAAFFLAQAGAAQAVEPLTVNGNRILAGGQARSFAGSSLFWSNTGWGGDRFYNIGALSRVKQDWNATLVRASMGVDEEGTFLEDPESNKSRVTDCGSFHGGSGISPWQPALEVVSVACQSAGYDNLKRRLLCPCTAGLLSSVSR